jgi:hypothetical protein
LTAGVWVIATVAIGMVLNQGARILAPFAMAIFVWLVMEGFSRAIRRPVPNLPGWLAYLFAVTIVVLSIVIFIGVIRGAVEEFVAKSSEYERHINDIIRQVYTQLNLFAPAGPACARTRGAVRPAANCCAAPVQQCNQHRADCGQRRLEPGRRHGARLYLCRLPDRVG